jgi:ADP-ribose pyrophosphatase YjhB (NUDIX family)
MMHVMKKLPSTGVGVGIGQDMEVLFVRRGTSESRAKWQLGGLGLFRRRLLFRKDEERIDYSIPGSIPESGESLDAVDDFNRWKKGWFMCDCSAAMFVEAGVV